MLTLAFCIIASGNSLFGLLHLRVSRALGEMAYSIYLLHGLLLFTTLIVLDQKGGPPFSATHHWGVILALTPVLIILCRLTYLGIERPGNRQVDRLTRLVSRQGTPLTQGPNGAEMRKAG
jgi:peptidoglycan/LPS O-acetylase OafA/YrhL